MSSRVKIAIAAVLVAGVGYGLSRPAGARLQPADDKARYLKIEENLIFQALGAQAWKIHLPASDLAGKTSCVLKMQLTGKDPVAVLTGRLHPNRAPNADLVVTVVLNLGTTEYQTVKRVHLTLASKEFSVRRSMGSPIEGFDGIGRDSEAGDPSAGLKLGSLSSSRDDTRAHYSLWVE